MKKNTKIALLVLFIFKLIVNVTLSKEIETTLYTSNDDVEFLDYRTHDSTLLLKNSTKCTLIQYFVHWCGGCQRTAPFWKKLAKETRAWKSFIQVAALDCALQVNRKLCDSLSILRYPTFRLFDATQYGQKAIEIDEEQKHDVDEFIKIMIDHIERQINKPTLWPNLNYYTNDSLDNFFENSLAMYGIIVFENENSYFGRKIILDYWSLRDQILIKRVSPLKNPKLAIRLSIEPNDSFKQPKVAFIIRNDSKVILINSTDMYQSIQYFIKTMITNGTYTSFSNKTRTIITQLNNTNAEYHLYVQDLESGLNYMLRREISRIKLIKNESLGALKTWLKVLVKYFPSRKQVRLYLRRILYEVNKSKDQLKSDQWKQIILYETSDSYLAQTSEWIHCKGSLSSYRGYPCSLWSIFHVLTVSHAQALKTNRSSDLYEVTRAIQNYVEHFFSCRECTRNFRQEMVNYESYIKEANDVIEFMWRVHNHVNERLAGDYTEDPFNPKIQFPSREKCPKCYDNSTHTFISEQVVLYLISFYSGNGIKFRK